MKVLWILERIVDYSKKCNEKFIWRLFIEKSLVKILKIFHEQAINQKKYTFSLRLQKLGGIKTLINSPNLQSKALSLNVAN